MNQVIIRRKPTRDFEGDIGESQHFRSRKNFEIFMVGWKW